MVIGSKLLGSAMEDAEKTELKAKGKIPESFIIERKPAMKGQCMH